MNASHKLAIVVAACIGVGCGDAAPPPVVAPLPRLVAAAPPQCPKDLIVEVDGDRRCGSSEAAAR